MSTPYFDFKQFRVQHDRCAMKVGTDGVLLGAWADVGDKHNVLDIGTGTGLIALMVAQRSRASITGIDIDHDAAGQAMENAANSPFSSRITIIETALQEHTTEIPYDCILSNPPFFEEDLLPPNAARAAARNASTLPFPVLVENASRLLTKDGSLQIIVPTNAVFRIQSICAEKRFALVRQTDIATTPRKAPKRSLLHFVREPFPHLPKRDILLLCDTNGGRSEEYARLTKDFYLDK